MAAARQPYRGATKPDLAKRERITVMWREGHDLKAIAAAVDSTPGAVRTMISRLRREGVDLSYVRGPISREDLEQRLAAAKAGGERSGRGNLRRVQVLELRLEGLDDHQIAERLGCAVTTVRGAHGDPDGTRKLALNARRDHRCVQCGSEIKNYHNRGESRCRSCAGKLGHPKLVTRDVIKAWMQAEARRIGKTPSLSQVKRGEAPFSVSQVQREFGPKEFWRNACEYSGLVARPVGGLPREDSHAADVTWRQRTTVLRLGGSLTFDGDSVEVTEAQAA